MCMIMAAGKAAAAALGAPGRVAGCFCGAADDAARQQQQQKANLQEQQHRLHQQQQQQISGFAALFLKRCKL